MLTWDEVRSYIREQYKPTQEADTWLNLRCEFPDAGFQTLSVALRETPGGPAVEFVAIVDDTARINAFDALTYNHNTYLGALVLQGKTFLLRHVQRLKDLTNEALDEILIYIASEAVRLRLRTASPPVGPELFSYLAA